MTLYSQVCLNWYKAMRSYWDMLQKSRILHKQRYPGCDCTYCFHQLFSLWGCTKANKVQLLERTLLLEGRTLRARLRQRCSLLCLIVFHQLLHSHLQEDGTLLHQELLNWKQRKWRLFILNFKWPLKRKKNWHLKPCILLFLINVKIYNCLISLSHD